MITNLLIPIIIFLFILIGVKRGLAKTFFGLISLVVAAVLTYYISGFFANLIYDSFVKQTLITNLQTTISQNSITDAVTNSFSALPQWALSVVSGFMAIFGTNPTDFTSSFNIQKDQAAQSVASSIEQLVKPVVTGIFAMLLSILIFIIVMIILRKIIKLVVKIFEVPVIRQINKVLGGVLGACEGIVFVWIAVNITAAIVMVINNNYLTDTVIYGQLFNWFCLI